MTQNNERKYGSLYFEKEEVNGKKSIGQYKPIRIRLLYADVEQIPMGRAHLFEYSSGKYAKVLCLNDGKSKKDTKVENCPLCAHDRFGTPASKLFAFVSDLNDDGKLKLFEFSYTLGKQLSEMANEMGTPLHNIEFTIRRSGTNKETTYTPIPKNIKEFSVKDYFFDLGLDEYPKLAGAPSDRPAILQLSYDQIEKFIDGDYPWSSGEGATKRKFTSLTGATTTIHGLGETSNAIASSKDFDEVSDVSEDFDLAVDDDTSGGLF